MALLFAKLISQAVTISAPVPACFLSTIDTSGPLNRPKWPYTSVQWPEFKHWKIHGKHYTTYPHRVLLLLLWLFLMWSLPAKLSKYCLLFQPPNNRTFFKLTKMNLHSSTLIFAKQEFYFKFILDYSSQGLTVWAGQPDLYLCWIVLPRVKDTCQCWWTTFMHTRSTPFCVLKNQIFTPLWWTLNNL